MAQCPYIYTVPDSEYKATGIKKKKKNWSKTLYSQMCILNSHKKKTDAKPYQTFRRVWH